MQDIRRSGKRTQQTQNRGALTGDARLDDAPVLPSARVAGLAQRIASLPPSGWAIVAFAGSILLADLVIPSGSFLQRLVADLAFLGTSGLAAAVCLRTSTRLGAAGRSWLWLGLGCVSWFGGQLVWTIYELMLRSPVPYPSLADVGYLLFYPLAAAAVGTLIRTASPDLEFEILLDGLIIGAAASLLSYELLLRPLWLDYEGHVLALASSLLWQGGAIGLLVLAAVSPVWATDPKDRRSMLVLLAGLFVFSIASVIYGRLALEGTYRVGSVLDLGWNLGFLLMATAALVAGGNAGPSQYRAQAISLGRRLAGSIGSVLAFGWLTAYAASQPRESNVLPIGFAVVAVLIAARLAYAALQANRLTLRTRERDRLAAEVAAREATQEEMTAALIAQRTANDELAQLNKSKSEFVTTVSHEFRTPLTSIQGFSELIATEVETIAEAQAFARTINANAVHLAQMISDQLDLDRIESGRAVSDFMEASLNDMVERVLAELRTTTSRHSLVARLDSDLPSIRCNPNLMIRVITNLVANAIKYSPAGGPVTVTTSGSPDGVQLSVTDEGLGLPPDEREAIFVRYVRIARPEQKGIHGSGLGLTIARQIVELHGGKIWADSNRPVGSIFQVVLPRVEADPS